MDEGNRIIIATTNSILECAAEKNILLTPLKLQKLLYINYGIELTEGKGFREYMKFEAWTYGPVLPMIYHKYKYLGGELIKNKLTDEEDNVIRLIHNNHVLYTIKEYGNLRGAQLVDLLHRKEGAWWKAFSVSGNNTPIEHEEIKNEFERLQQ